MLFNRHKQSKYIYIERERYIIKLTMKFIDKQLKDTMTIIYDTVFTFLKENGNIFWWIPSREKYMVIIDYIIKIYGYYRLHNKNIWLL